MNIEDKIQLNTSDIKKISSDYLNEGRKQESWQINNVEIQGMQLMAEVSMCSVYLSKSDNEEFHLTIFSTLEFLSQLMIIYGHVWSDRTEKQREGWMIESHTRSVRAIRNPKQIQIKMTVQKMRKRGENLYCLADYQVSDPQGGLMEVQLKGFLS